MQTDDRPKVKATERRPIDLTHRTGARALTTDEGQRLEREELEFKRCLYSTAWHGHAF